MQGIYDMVACFYQKLREYYAFHASDGNSGNLEFVKWKILKSKVSDVTNFTQPNSFVFIKNGNLQWPKN